MHRPRTFNKVLVPAILVAGILALGSAQPARASLFVSMSNSGTTVSCDNSTAGGVSACLLAGFATSLNGTGLSFIGTVGSYNITSYSLSNAPSTPNIGEVLDSAFTVTHTTGTGMLTVDFSTYNMTAPAGPQLGLSGSQSATWTVSSPSDFQQLQVWGRPDNQPIIPGSGVGGVTLTTPQCNATTAPPTFSCSSSTAPATATFTKTGNYALTGQQVISEGNSTTGTFSAVVDAVNAPEPTSWLLLGFGLLGIGIVGRRKKLGSN